MLFPSTQSRQEPQVFDPLTSAQKKEVDEAFAIFDYASTGTLNLYEVKVGVSGAIYYSFLL